MCNSPLPLCPGLLESLLREVSSWLDQHPSEIVVLFFGNIARPEETVPRLIATLRSVFPRGGPGVGMNSVYKTEGRWPTLGEAKEGDSTFSRFYRGHLYLSPSANDRVFVFIRDKSGSLVTADNREMMREVKVKEGRPVGSHPADGAVTVLSGYKAR